MSDASSSNGSHPTSLRQIDIVADCFESSWREGHPPRILAYLDSVPVEQRLLLLAELVCIDLEQRLRHRLPVALADYFRDFPELTHLPPATRDDLESHACKYLGAPGQTTDLQPATVGTVNRPASIGRYAIAGLLGSGGQADVFLSFHPDLRIPVVVKWHKCHDLEDAQREQIIREGRTLASLTPHPNLVRVYDLGFHEGRPFLVLEYISGRTLQQCGQDERLAPARAAKLVAMLARGVDSAHKQGAIHQDINPCNAILDGFGEARLIDFGLAWFRPAWDASLAETRPDAGTPRYLSPEQADPSIGPVSARTDVFGLGAVLYYLLTGRALYDGASMNEVLQQAARAAHDVSALEAAGVPKRLTAVCRKALAREPDQRFATAAELAEALTAALRRSRWRVVAVLALLFLAATMGGWLLGRSGGQGRNSEVEGPALEVQVVRKSQGKYSPLRAVLPVRTGDRLQVRFRVPAGLHVGLFSVNGAGRLSLLEHYPSQTTATALVWPARDHANTLQAPAGTEVLLVCGRREGAIGAADLQAVWDGSTPWPRLDPPGRLLRLQPGGVSEEGERARDFGATHFQPESDTVARKLESLREGLKPICAFFEAVAFAHE
jgi:tRNA A-37 threonylcarbamoyl transferase component Bud32